MRYLGKEPLDDFKPRAVRVLLMAFGINMTIRAMDRRKQRRCPVPAIIAGHRFRVTDV